MTPNSLRSFAAGLLAAAILTGGAYFFGPSEAKSTEKPEDKTEKAAKQKVLTDKEMIDLLSSKGYVINTEDEWSKQLAAAAKTNEKKEEKTEEKSNKETGEKVVYRTILTVSMGMTSIDVGNALERANIIESGVQFYKDVEKRGLANELRPGTFEVESGMTTDEIISVIFK
jgi:cell division protein YceG involved in septum cleavage